MGFYLALFVAVFCDKENQMWYENAFFRQNRNRYTNLMHRKHFWTKEKVAWVALLSFIMEK